jgi:hypothetical protein
VAEQLELFTEGLDTMERRYRYWDSFDEETRKQARKAIRHQVAAMPQGIREEYAAALRQAGARMPERELVA